MADFVHELRYYTMQIYHLAIKNNRKCYFSDDLQRIKLDGNHSTFQLELLHETEVLNTSSACDHNAFDIKI